MKKVQTSAEKASKIIDNHKKATEGIATHDTIVLRYLGECALELLSTDKTITADSFLALLKGKDYSKNPVMQLTNEAAQKMLLGKADKSI